MERNLRVEERRDNTYMFDTGNMSILAVYIFNIFLKNQLSELDEKMGQYLCFMKLGRTRRRKTIFLLFCFLLPFVLKEK